MLWLAIGALLLALLTGLTVARGMRGLRRIEQLEPLPAEGAPLVSIVVAARNEERGIEAGLKSLQDQVYPALEILVVNDRSTDATGAIVHRIAASDRRIVPLHVERLPSGWLGKNHALAAGAEQARGGWLLFADADVVMAPDVVSRVMGHALQHELDHVPMTPRLELPGAVLQAFAVVFTFFFCAYFQPWKASDPKSPRFVGVGAFNLVRRSAYQRAGTHRRIALRPDDDVKLGKILKQSGARQELVVGAAKMRVAWYHSLRELVVGLEKNAFAGLDYRVGMAIAGVVFQLILILGPFAGLVVADGPVRGLFLLSILVTLASFMAAAKDLGVPRSRAFLYPLVVLLFDYIVARTTVKNLVDGGIRWRDTFYPLDQLKANRV